MSISYYCKMMPYIVSGLMSVHAWCQCMQTVQESLAIAQSVITSLAVATSVKVCWSFPQELACALVHIGWSGSWGWKGLTQPAHK